MARTRTGSFPIGFRRGWSPWQRDLATLVDFAKSNDFAFLDFGPAPVDELKQAQSSGIRIGSVDLKDWKDLASPDAGRRRAAAQANAEYVAAVVAAVGVRAFLAVVIPEDPARPRPENFAAAVDGYGQLMQAIAPTGARVVLEGWPGQAPHYASLACTPADCRAFFAAVGSDALGVNFDPSHLIRMGIDPARFLTEFAPRVFHAHAKDTRVLPDGLYDHGHTQQATFDKPHEYGGHAWCYTLPGHGDADWPRLLAILADSGYAARSGLLSIEMEDGRFNGTEEAERRGLIGARDFLAGA